MKTKKPTKSGVYQCQLPRRKTVETVEIVCSGWPNYSLSLFLGDSHYQLDELPVGTRWSGPIEEPE